MYSLTNECFTKSLAWENSWRFPRSPLEPSQNDDWATSAEIPYWWPVTIQILVVLLIGWKKIPTNQKHYQDLGSDASSVGNFCTRYSDVILRGLKWRPRCFLRLLNHELVLANMIIDTVRVCFPAILHQPIFPLDPSKSEECGHNNNFLEIKSCSKWQQISIRSHCTSTTDSSKGHELLQNTGLCSSPRVGLQEENKQT